MTPARPLPAVLTSIWAIALAAGFAFMVDFDVAPGGSGDPPNVWPPSSSIPRVAGRPELLVLLHPRCACSRASLAELEWIMARSHGGLVAHVMIVIPPGAGSGFADTGTRRRAGSIPGVVVIDDPGGGEARRFGITTSGHALLYDTDGILRFSGGITPSRGHQGDNVGSQAIVAFVNHQTTPRRATPVYGCSLGA